MAPPVRRTLYRLEATTTLRQPPVRRTLPRLEATTALRQPPALADDLLEEILLRIASPADLARASAACASFRRLVADPVFLAKYRSRHPPLLLGFLHSASGGFHPAEAPHPSAAAARALAGAAGFSFDDYLPRGRGSRWCPCDVRDGRVLLQSSAADEEVATLPDLAVCCPLSRRYLLLPRLPDDIFQAQEQRFQGFEAFLVPSGDWEHTSFRVIAKTNYMKKLAIFIFFSGSRRWNVGTFTSWEALSLPPDGHNRISCLLAMHWLHSYAYGCFYWKLYRKSKMIKFDINNMEFSTVDLPPGYDKRKIVIVEAGEGMIGMFSQMSDSVSLQYTICQNEGDMSNELKMGDIIPSPVVYRRDIVAASGGYIMLLGHPPTAAVDTVALSLDIKRL
ncbi:hypothetical protein ACP70R_005644 [Stipagrostis hirtigluma subsp. patula]